MKEFLLSIIAGIISNKFSETFKPFQKTTSATVYTHSWFRINLGFIKYDRIKTKVEDA